MQTYLEPTQAAARTLISRNIAGEIVMLNLLRLRQVADYTANPELAPAKPISGAEAYDRYIAHALPYLVETGGDVLFLGEGGPFLIGPEGERSDRATSRNAASGKASSSSMSRNRRCLLRGRWNS